MAELSLIATKTVFPGSLDLVILEFPEFLDNMATGQNPHLVPLRGIRLGKAGQLVSILLWVQVQKTRHVFMLPL